jgi:hypothetical protein
MCSRGSVTNDPTSDSPCSYTIRGFCIKTFVLEFSEAYIHACSTADCADHAGSIEV